MKKMNMLLRKCKSLSRQLGRSSSYSSLRSKSTRDHSHHRHRRLWCEDDHDHDQDDQDKYETIYVGSTRKRYVINSKYLSHPLLNALMEKSQQKDIVNINGAGGGGGGDYIILVKCEVVLFDHLLWMLDNSDPNLFLDSFEELAALYVF